MHFSRSNKMSKKINKVDVNKYNEIHGIAHGAAVFAGDVWQAAQEAFNADDFDLHAQFKQLTSKKEEIERQLNEVRTKLYEQGVSEKVNPYVNKWVKIPGTMSTDEYVDIKKQYRIFHIDGIDQWIGGDCIYFKISDLVTVTHRKEDNEECIKFGGYSLDSYRVENIANLTILTEKQVCKELDKINKIVNKRTEKIFNKVL